MRKTAGATPLRRQPAPSSLRRQRRPLDPCSRLAKRRPLHGCVRRKAARPRFPRLSRAGLAGSVKRIAVSPIRQRPVVDTLLEALATLQFTYYLSFQARPREAD